MSYTNYKDLAQPIFFAVSLWKVALMSVCTVGLYQVYWFYSNWRLVKLRERRRLSAPWRSVLGILFAYPLFQRISRAAGSHRKLICLAVVAFLLWVGLSLVVYAPLPWAVVSLASVVPLLPMQAVANSVNLRAAPGHIPNSRIRGWNILALVVGGPLALLNLLGFALHWAQA